MEHISNVMFILKPYKSILRSNFLTSELDESKLENQDIDDTLQLKIINKVLRLKESFISFEKATLYNPNFSNTLVNEIMYSSHSNIISELASFYNTDSKTIRKEVQNNGINEKKPRVENLFFITNAPSDIFTVNLENIIDFNLDYVDVLKTPTNYMLDDTKGLFTELAKINPFDKKDILRFARYFGLPSGVNDLGENNLVFIAVSHIYLLKLLLEYKNTFDLFIASKTNDSSIVDRINDNLLSFQLEIEIEKLSIYTSKEDALHFINDTLAENLNKLLKNNINRSFYYSTAFRGYKEDIYLTDLFSIAYQQMKNSLIEETPLKICKNCGHYFELNHAKQSFCPPLPLIKRSSCEIAYYKKKNKKKGE